jgi:hypothetical protein
MILLDAALNAPLSGISMRWPRAIHAVELDELIAKWLKKRTYTAPCGARHLRLLASEGRPLLFPPPAIVDDIPRCRDCWVATGRKRPRRPRPLSGRRE